jgi:predicted site-specific integrase-resolvase
MQDTQTATVNTPVRRTALYARVSTSDQAKGLDAQERALRIFCEQNKITNFELYSDENQSGTKSSRLVTGNSREQDIIESCLALNISLLPKEFVHVIPLKPTV